MSTTIAQAASCPTCHQPVEQPRTGRCRTFCSAACRRQMYTAIAELHALERELAETIALARGPINEHWRMRHERTNRLPPPGAR
jgi:hypothetical protein